MNGDNFDVRKLSRRMKDNKLFNMARKLTDIEKIYIKKVTDTAVVHIAEKYSVKNYIPPATSVALHDRRCTFGQVNYHQIHYVNIHNLWHQIQVVMNLLHQ